MNPEKKEKIYNWFGVRFTNTHLYGIFGLIILFGYFGENESSKKEESLFTKPSHLNERKEGFPVYVTGQVQSSTIQSKYIKPGKYIKIYERSEVFSLGETNDSKGRKVSRLIWQEDPKGQKSVKDETLHISAGDQKYRIDPEQVSYSYLEEHRPMKPELSNVNLLEYKIIGKDEVYGKESLALFKTEACEKEPQEGCRRIIIQVQKGMEGTYTFLGDVKSDAIVPFNNEIRAVKGDIKEAQEQMSGSAGVTYFIMNFVQIFIFTGVWFCVYLLKELFIVLPFQKTLSLAKSTALTAFVLSLGARIFFMHWYLVWLVCLGIFIWSGRNFSEERKV